MRKAQLSLSASLLGLLMAACAPRAPFIPAPTALAPAQAAPGPAPAAQVPAKPSWEERWEKTRDEGNYETISNLAIGPYDGNFQS